MPCKGNHHDLVGVRTYARYVGGRVYCSECAISFIHDGRYCPCCRMRVRMKVKYSLRRQAIARRKLVDRSVRKCRWCPKKFTPFNSHHLFCSRLCRDRAYVKVGRAIPA